MPREFSSNTKLVYWWLWRWPWVLAGYIAGVSGLKPQAVSNALKRRRDRGWFLSDKLGWVFDEVDRFVLSSKGVEEPH